MLDTTLLTQNIITLLGLQGISPDRQAALIERMVELVQKRAVLRLLDDMSEDQAEKANQVFSSGTDEEKAAFLQTIPNMKQILEEEVITVKQELIDDAAKAIA